MTPTERNEVSIHEVKVFQALAARSGDWLSNRELAALVEGVSYRTVRAHTMKFVRLGLLDQADVFPAHRYRLAATAGKRNKTYLQRLEQAASVFRVTL